MPYKNFDRNLTWWLGKEINKNKNKQLAKEIAVHSHPLLLPANQHEKKCSRSHFFCRVTMCVRSMQKALKMIKTKIKQNQAGASRVN